MSAVEPFVAGEGLSVGPFDGDCVVQDGAAMQPILEMAMEGARQHPRAVRCLWRDKAIASSGKPCREMVAVGGVVQINAGEGYAFFKAFGDVGPRGWRVMWPIIFSITEWGHERGLRNINAVVAANHADGHRMIRRMGYLFNDLAMGFGGEDVPMLRYCHARPRFEVPAMVQHQRVELWLACLEAWCPDYYAEILAEWQ